MTEAQKRAAEARVMFTRALGELGEVAAFLEIEMLLLSAAAVLEQTAVERRLHAAHAAFTEETED